MTTKFLEKLGIDYELIEHEPVYTVAESAIHLPGKYPVKNLFLREEKGGKQFLVIMKGDERLDMKKLSGLLSSRKLHFAPPELLMSSLGVTPGSVSLFSLLNRLNNEIETIIDSRLISQEKLGFHPSDNTKTILIAGTDVLVILESMSTPYRVFSFEQD